MDPESRLAPTLFMGSGCSLRRGLKLASGSQIQLDQRAAVSRETLSPRLSHFLGRHEQRPFYGNPRDWLSILIHLKAFLTVCNKSVN